MKKSGIQKARRIKCRQTVFMKMMAVLTKRITHARFGVILMVYVIPS